MSLNISEICFNVINPNYNVIQLFTISVSTPLFFLKSRKQRTHKFAPISLKNKHFSLKLSL